MDGKIMAEEDKAAAAGDTAGNTKAENTGENLGVVFGTTDVSAEEPEIKPETIKASGATEEVDVVGEAPPDSKTFVVDAIDDAPRIANAAPREPVKVPPPQEKPTIVVPPERPVVTLQKPEVEIISAKPPQQPQPVPPKIPEPKPSGVTPPTPVTVESKTGEALKKKTFPAPQELKPTEKKQTGIPSAVSLDKIELPAYMKGFFAKKLEEGGAGKVSPTVARGIREIGVREVGVSAPPPIRPPTPVTDLRVVAVAKDKRTEIDENGLPRIRTYAADMSGEIQRRGASLSSIVGAERERAVEMQKAKTTDTRRTGERRLVLLAIAVVLLIAGISAVAGAVYVSQQKPPPEITPGIIVENQKVSIPASEAREFIRALSNERRDAELSLGEIERIVVVGEDGSELAAPEILALLGAPPTLSRNTRNVMLGIHAFDRNQPFVIAEVAFYDLAFSAMLAWENDMAESLGGFFAPLSVSTAPSTLHFVDGIFKNIDTRKSDGTWPILYAFPEEKLIIITTNENTLTEILSRLAIIRSR